MNYNLSSANEKIILIFVGLPARGKSFYANNLCRYLKWIGLRCNVFNAENFRRNIMPGYQSAKFFDPANIKLSEKREEMCKMCFLKLLRWLEKDGNIGILDAANSTIERRQMLIEIVNNNQKGLFKTIFIEVITNDEKIINNNLVLKSKLPYYEDMDKEQSINDFKKRISFQEKIQKTINNNENLNYIKLIKENNKLIINNIQGIIESMITSYLQNLKINKQPIYLTRHGESEQNVDDRIGGDSILTKKGKLYAKNLYNYFTNEITENHDEIVIFTSCLKRTIQTSKQFKCKKQATNLLNEINAGICNNMTYEEIEITYPHISSAREKDKLGFRYPEGESYQDLLERLRQFVLQLQCIESPILIVAHRAINRVLLSQFMGYELRNMPYIEVNLNEIIKLTNNFADQEIERIKI